jgi:hypothetical protein
MIIPHRRHLDIVLSKVLVQHDTNALVLAMWSISVNRNVLLN